MAQKTVLITGCSDGGIGAALAAEFQLRGLRVFATARDPSKMADLAALGVETLALDVTSEASIERAVVTVREKLNNSAISNKPDTAPEARKRLDFLINNAGGHRHECHWLVGSNAGIHPAPHAPEDL
ncbi:hypothetical protein NUW58_g9510 [Xylaria curta]|uniref:Uncharacterized protein n=1 Tax=Xylaria curta TaxID=42375 RepID=A0ACC1MWX4_9PEZI|nr:hypothetical protein NUW58_g9510 [Xylaria curta]